MGNKNNRARPTRQTAPASKSIDLPLQPPSQPPQCTDPHCEVKSSHDDTTYIPNQPNLPVYVQAKHTALDSALETRHFFQARGARDWLMGFYTLHGLSIEIASNGLPAIPPPPPKRCTDPDCPVTQFHHQGILNLWADDLPDMIFNGPTRLRNALQHGNYEHALSIHAFMAKFWRMHGDVDGSALLTLPEMPPICTDKRCTVQQEKHEDKKYARWVRDMSLPGVVKKYEWEVTKVHDRWDPGWVEMGEMELLDGFFAVHGGEE